MAAAASQLHVAVTPVQITAREERAEIFFSPRVR